MFTYKMISTSPLHLVFILQYHHLHQDQPFFPLAGLSEVVEKNHMTEHIISLHSLPLHADAEVVCN